MKSYLKGILLFIVLTLLYVGCASLIIETKTPDIGDSAIAFKIGSINGPDADYYIYFLDKCIYDAYDETVWIKNPSPQKYILQLKNKVNGEIFEVRYRDILKDNNYTVKLIPLSGIKGNEKTYQIEITRNIKI